MSQRASKYPTRLFFGELGQALLASDRDGELLNPAKAQSRISSQQMATLAVAKPPMRGLRQGVAQWVRPELHVRVKHLKAKGVLRHATVKLLITD